MAKASSGGVQLIIPILLAAVAGVLGSSLLPKPASAQYCETNYCNETDGEIGPYCDWIFYSFQCTAYRDENGNPYCITEGCVVK